MELSYTSIPNVTPVKMVSATSTYGVGLLTYIVMGFCAVFGIECSLYNKKVEKAKAAATSELIFKASAANADGIMQIQYQLSGLTILMYGVAYTKDTAAAPSQPVEAAVAPTPAPAPASESDASNYDTWTCKHCGTQNKSFTMMCKKCGQYK